MGTQFRPCIDLHDGKVKQIVGGTLQDTSDEGLKTNFVAKESPGYYAALYRNHQLTGAHVIKLGPGNDEAAREALQAWPTILLDGLQLGGGITIENAKEWISYGASKVIVTSWLFPEGVFQLERLQALSSEIGKDRLVVDLSCRRTNSGWSVAINRWQTMTEFQINQVNLINGLSENLSELANYCSEFLVHAADVEGLCKGIDQELVQHLGALSPIPVTYAGGANSILDLPLVHRLSNGRVDLSFGSALDIFGGHLVTLTDCVQWNTTGSVPQ